MIRRLTGREQNIFIAALAAVICAVFYNGLIGPLQVKKDFLDREITVQREQLDRDLKSMQMAEALGARYDVYLKQFRRSGTEEEIASSILSEIEEVAGRFGLHVTDLKPQKIQYNEHDSQFSVGLTISSGLVDIVRFLYVLQQSPHLFDVEEVEFEKSARRGQSTTTTRLVLGKVFISSVDPRFHGDDIEGGDDSSSRVIPAEAGIQFHGDDMEGGDDIGELKPFEVYAKGLETRDLFQSLRDRLKTDTPGLKKALPALHKRIKLIGILLDEDSKAIVEDLEGKQTHFLSKGESLGTVFLEDIQGDKVIFMYNNERVEMTP